MTESEIKSVIDRVNTEVSLTVKENLEKLKSEKISKEEIENIVTTKVSTGYKVVQDECERLSSEITALKEIGNPNANINPYHAIKQEELDKFNDGVIDKYKVVVKAASSMLVSTNISGNTNFNLTLENGLAQAPRNTPLMIKLADVRIVRNNGQYGVPAIGWVNKKNSEGNAAITAEGGTKPLRDFDIVGETESAKEISVRTKVGKYMLRDVKDMQQTIDMDLGEEMSIVADNQYLDGSGSSGQMKGLFQYATAYTTTALDGVVPDANDVDAILAALYQLRSLNFGNNVAAVVNPITYTNIYTWKGQKFRDINIAPVQERNGVLYVDNVRVEWHNSIPAGDILIGDFSKSHIRIFDDIEIELGHSNDDFDKNMQSVRADMRALHFVKDVEKAAFIYDSLANIKAAITV